MKKLAAFCIFGSLAACNPPPDSAGEPTEIVLPQAKTLAATTVDDALLSKAHLDHKSIVRARKKVDFENMGLQVIINKIETPDGPTIVGEDQDGNIVDLDAVAMSERAARRTKQGNLDTAVDHWRLTAEASSRTTVLLSNLPQPSEVLGRSLVGLIEVGSPDARELLQKLGTIGNAMATKVRSVGGAVQEVSYGAVVAEVQASHLTALMRDASIPRIELHPKAQGERLANYAFETTVGATTPLNGSWSNYPRVGVGIVEDQRPAPSNLWALPPIASNGIFHPGEFDDSISKHVSKAASVVARTTGGQLGIAPYEELVYANTGPFPNDISVAASIGWLIDASMGGPGASVASVSFTLVEADTSFISTCTQRIRQHERMMDYASGNFTFLAVAGAGNSNYGDCVVNRLRNGLVVGGANDDPTLSPYGSWKNPGFANSSSFRGDWELPHVVALASVDTPFGSFSGTSAATPQVAGAVSRIQSVVKKQSGARAFPQAVRAIIMASAKPIATQAAFSNTGADDKVGAGLLDVRVAEEIANSRRLTNTTNINPAPPSGHTEGYWSSTLSSKNFWIQRGSGNNLRVALSFTATERCSAASPGFWQCEQIPGYTLAMDLDVEVRDSQNNFIACGAGGFSDSRSFDNTYEYVDCRGMSGLAPGPLFIKVTKFSHTVSNMPYGLAWRQF